MVQMFHKVRNNVPSPADEVVLYGYIEWLKEQTQLYSVGNGTTGGGDHGELRVSSEDADHLNQPGLAEEEEGPEELECVPEAGLTSSKKHRKGAADESLIEDMAARIVSGEPFTERKSTFQVRKSLSGYCASGIFP